MVNFGWNLAAILGLLNILGAACALILTFTSIRDGLRRVISPANLIFTVCCTPCLFFSGVILLFNGWRLDPILLIQQLCMQIIVYISLIKEIINLMKARN